VGRLLGRRQGLNAPWRPDVFRGLSLLPAAATGEVRKRVSPAMKTPSGGSPPAHAGHLTGRVPDSARSALVLALLLVASTWVISPAPRADATFPGPNGLIAFDRGEHIFVIRPDGSGEQLLTGDLGDVNRTPAVSPDGRKIAFRSGFDVWTMNANGSGKVNLTADLSLSESEPAWSPDGRRIAFQTASGSNAAIWVMNADGSGKVNLTGSLGRVGNPDWSPDGQRIAFNKGFGLATMNPDGTDIVDVPVPGSVTDSHPSWSPDGGSLAIEAYGPEIRRVPAAGGPGVLVAARGERPSWSPDGTEIAFSARGALQRVTAGGGPPVAITAQGTNPSWGALADVTSTTTSLPLTTTTMPPGIPQSVCDLLPPAVLALLAQSFPGACPPPSPPPPPTCAGLVATIVGTEGNDQLTGTGGNDVIVALGGNDVVSGGAGRDTICGGEGNDVLSGGTGQDLLLGEAGNDRLFGGANDDRLNGGPGFDWCDGGGGNNARSLCERRS